MLYMHSMARYKIEKTHCIIGGLFPFSDFLAYLNLLFLDLLCFVRGQQNRSGSYDRHTVHAQFSPKLHSISYANSALPKKNAIRAFKSFLLRCDKIIKNFFLYLSIFIWILYLNFKWYF